MKTRHKRFILIGVVLALLAGAAALVLNTFSDNIVFFQTPSEVATGKVPQGRTFRLGGMVVAGSLVREADGLSSRFAITDTAKIVPVRFTGALPDLFKEGKGAVAQGKLGPDGVFVATEVLAKHDENYMPPEAKDAVDRAHATAKTLK
ncbi:cytochrome c maturation protein CcmE [Uliginosibacterium gangwonense]|uniref:cytochrome c maturation protein CcmE n=1 Tax=Uliginosibacterium gangwonense TaxID=392736 RepID=UPI00036096E0|nr:cytochrome c maturation protein CcmE [Uliginosibacterium gangwonense]